MGVDPTLKVDKSKLSELQLHLLDSSNVIADYNDNIFSLVSSLNAGWTGPDYDEFVSYFYRHKPTLDGIAKLFSIYADKVKEFDEQGEILIKAIESALGLITYSGGSGYSLQDTKEIEGVTVAYAVSENPKDSKEARIAAEEVRSNLDADIMLLNQELKTIDINKKALEKRMEELSKIKAPNGEGTLYDMLLAELIAHEKNVSENLALYIDAYDFVSGQVERKFWPWLEDGAFVEADDGFLWSNNYVDQSIEACKALNQKLAQLRPVTTIIESASLNGLNDGTEYVLDNFYNGSSVSTTMMVAAKEIAKENNDYASTVVDGRTVILFNSREFVNSGLTDENGYYVYMDDSTDRTFSQNDAYGYDYGEGCTKMDGYDSILIEGKNGEPDEYLTVEQYYRRYGGGE